MQAGYFNAAWHDIKNSPGWFGKLLVLGLVSLRSEERRVGKECRL